MLKLTRGGHKNEYIFQSTSSEILCSNVPENFLFWNFGKLIKIFVSSFAPPVHHGSVITAYKKGETIRLLSNYH
jgi:hypothetical protein